jgi:hypothetical protein
MSLLLPNGLVMVGSAADSQPFAAVTPYTVANGVTYRSGVVEVPRDSEYMSFEITLEPSGPCAAVVKVLTGNRYAAILPVSGGVQDSSFTSFTSSTSVIVSMLADCNWVQIEITPTGADVAATVVGTVR